MLESFNVYFSKPQRILASEFSCEINHDLIKEIDKMIKIGSIMLHDETLVEGMHGNRYKEINHRKSASHMNFFCVRKT